MKAAAAAVQGMLLMDASEKMDSLNLLRYNAVTVVLRQHS